MKEKMLWLLMEDCIVNEVIEIMMVTVRKTKNVIIEKQID
jgi:hypothetical protein